MGHKAGNTDERYVDVFITFCTVYCALKFSLFEMERLAQTIALVHARVRQWHIGEKVGPLWAIRG